MPPDAGHPFFGLVSGISSAASGARDAYPRTRSTETMFCSTSDAERTSQFCERGQRFILQFLDHPEPHGGGVLEREPDMQLTSAWVIDIVYVINSPTSPASTLLLINNAETATKALENINHDPKNSKRTASHRLMVMAGL